MIITPPPESANPGPSLGRVDQAIEIPLPDAESRGKLFDLYAQGLSLGNVDRESCVRRTHGSSAAFMREMMHEVTLFAADTGSDTVEDRHFDEAIHELLVEGGILTKRLLGFLDANSAGDES